MAKAKAQTHSNNPDAEITAISKVYDALSDLDTAAQSRVIRYVTRRLALADVFERNEDNMQDEDLSTPHQSIRFRAEPDQPLVEAVALREGATRRNATPGDDSLEEGISPVALKWMKRSDISAEKLSRFFTIGVDEIDLVAKKVPGKNKAEKFRSVLLLKGVAAYLGTGMAKIDHKTLKQAAGDYGADPRNNLTTYVKNMSAAVSGTAATGYTLTARGLTEARELILEMIEGKSK